MSKGILSSPPKRKKNPIAATVEYLALRSIVAVLRIPPLRAAYVLSEIVLFSLYFLVPRFRARSLEQMETAFGEKLTSDEKYDLLSQSIRYNAWFWADMFIAPYLLRRRSYQEQVDCSSITQLLDSLEVPGKSGFLMVSSHQGAPDIISLALGTLGYKTGVVARPPDNKYISSFIQKGREGFGRTEFAKNGALRPAYKHLKSNGILGLQIDQDAGDTGVFVPFFGKLASTHKGPATLALMSEMPTYMVFCIRVEARAFKFKLFVEELPKFPSDPIDDETIYQLTTAMTKHVETYTERFPEQYMWPHRRWKTRPKSESLIARTNPQPKQASGRQELASKS
ncbi:MAG: lysophospholipid acyltransferase family protein [Verrucomicrobiota bacterium]